MVPGKVNRPNLGHALIWDILSRIMPKLHVLKIHKLLDFYDVCVLCELVLTV